MPSPADMLSCIAACRTVPRVGIFARRVQLHLAAAGPSAFLPQCRRLCAARHGVHRRHRRGISHATSASDVAFADVPRLIGGLRFSIRHSPRRRRCASARRRPSSAACASCARAAGALPAYRDLGSPAPAHRRHRPPHPTAPSGAGLLQLRRHQRLARQDFVVTLDSETAAELAVATRARHQA